MKLFRQKPPSNIYLSAARDIPLAGVQCTTVVHSVKSFHPCWVNFKAPDIVAAVSCVVCRLYDYNQK